MTRQALLILSLLGSATLFGCSRHESCEKINRLGPQLEERLHLPGDNVPDSIKGPRKGTTRSLTPDAARRLLKEVKRLEKELPESADDATLRVVLSKLETRRLALERALEEFLAFDFETIEGGLTSGAVMPLRRAVVMSRNRLKTLADNAVAICSK